MRQMFLSICKVKDICMDERLKLVSKENMLSFEDVSFEMVILYFPSIFMIFNQVETNSLYEVR